MIIGDYYMPTDYDEYKKSLQKTEDLFYKIQKDLVGKFCKLSDVCFEDMEANFGDKVVLKSTVFEIANISQIGGKIGVQLCAAGHIFGTYFFLENVELVNG
jgi:hypothetical protein